VCSLPQLTAEEVKQVKEELVQELVDKLLSEVGPAAGSS
jgi:hypothetical protein